MHYQKRSIFKLAQRELYCWLHKAQICTPPSIVTQDKDTPLKRDILILFTSKELRSIAGCCTEISQMATSAMLQYEWSCPVLSCACIVVLLLRGWMFFFRVGHMGMVSFCSECKNWTFLTKAANTSACRRRLLYYKGMLYMIVWGNFIPLFWQSAFCSWVCKEGLPEVRSERINKAHWNTDPDPECGVVAIMSVNIDWTGSAVRSNLLVFFVVKEKKNKSSRNIKWCHNADLIIFTISGCRAGMSYWVLYCKIITR